MSEAMMSHILIADDERTVVEGLSLVLREHSPKTALTKGEAMACLREYPVDLAICDLFFPEFEDGLSLIREAKSLSPETYIVVLTGHGSIETAVQAIKAGADDYLEKIVPNEELKLKVEGFLKIARERKELGQLKALTEAYIEAGPDSQLIGRSPLIQEVMRKIKKAAGESKASVLLLGETGTGKEVAARMIHALSPRKQNPFLALDCPALPETLFESEIFGYEKGAFTDARQRKLGKVELAASGTLFLDEIGDLPLALQSKLLRFLETNEFYRLGGVRPILVDTRIIAATNQSLDGLIAKGKFREDLYYRLKVFVIEMPPLRQTKEDIPLLIGHFAKRFDPHERKRHLFTERVKQVFMEHSWPGNVRELRNMVECLLMTEDEEDVLRMLQGFSPPLAGEGRVRESQSPPAPSSACCPDPGLPYKEAKVAALERFERDYLRQVLEAESWNITRTAQRIGIAREELHRKIKRLGLRR
jgi:two-component system nitrogen regulation response regulator NtrX